MQALLQEWVATPKYSFLENNPELAREFALVEEKYAPKGEVVSRPLPEKTTSRMITECGCCGKLITGGMKAYITKALPTGMEHWREYANPAWIPIKRQKLKVKNELGEWTVKVQVTNLNQEGAKPTYFEKVRPINATWMCEECHSKPFTAAVSNMDPSPEATLDIADGIRSWKQKFGGRLVVVGFGRPIDSTVQMVCKQLGVTYQESKWRV